MFVSWFILFLEWYIESEGFYIRTLRNLLKDQMDYTILQIILDMHLQQESITKEEWQNATEELIKLLNPPTRMLEDYNE